MWEKTNGKETSEGTGEQGQGSRASISGQESKEGCGDEDPASGKSENRGGCKIEGRCRTPTQEWNHFGAPFNRYPACLQVTFACGLYGDARSGFDSKFQEIAIGRTRTYRAGRVSARMRSRAHIHGKERPRISRIARMFHQLSSCYSWNSWLFVPIHHEQPSCYPKSGMGEWIH